MNKTIFYYKQLTETEVGNKGTHEIYIRMPNNFNSEDFFQSELKDNEGVLETRFKVKNLTRGHENDELIELRFAYFVSSNKEKRIPGLGEFFKANDVHANDVVRLESRIKEGTPPSFYITFLRPNEIQLSPNSFYFSVINDSTQQKDNLLYVQTKKEESKNSLQQIYYGAPGTGKSHTINEATKGEDVIRTTFHPDSDYSTFVGAYKPTTIEEPGITIIKKDGVSIIDTDRREYKETKIVYEFVPQAFLQAYIAAWKKYANSGNGEPRKQFLVIEEINRGNCAQIFGDLFQLLDRNDDGFSEYPIKTDADMKKQLQKEFKELDIPQKDGINAMFKEHYPDIVKEVLNGDLLLLPDNFYIWATMNTSDQSLFPIDSAFKRRWDWEYEPIKYENTDWVIDIQGEKYLWTSFQKEVNRRIFEATNSEDKQLGDYFVNPRDGVITENILVNKILFYLWNDVCKDGEGDIFKVSDTEDVSFSELYIDKGKLIKLMDYLHVEKSMNGDKDQSSENEEENDEEAPTTPQSV